MCLRQERLAGESVRLKTARKVAGRPARAAAGVCGPADGAERRGRDPVGCACAAWAGARRAATAAQRRCGLGRSRCAASPAVVLYVLVLVAGCCTMPRNCDETGASTGACRVPVVRTPATFSTLGVSNRRMCPSCSASHSSCIVHRASVCHEALSSVPAPILPLCADASPPCANRVPAARV